MTAITAASGSHAWNTNGAWVGSVQPTAADDVTIPSGATVTLPTATTCVGRSLTVASGGALTWNTTTAVLNLGDATAGAGNVALSISSGATITLTGIGTLGFVSTSATQQTVTTGGKTLPNVSVNGAGGSWIMADALLSSGTFSRAAGAWDTGGYNWTHTTFASSGAGTKSLTLGTSTVSMTSTSAVTLWSMVGTNDTISALSSTIVVANASASTRTFTSGTFNYGTLTYTVAGSTGILNLTGFYYETINFSDASNARTLQFSNTSTVSVKFFNIFGTSGKAMTLKGNLSGGQSYLNVHGPPVNTDYMAFQDITCLLPHKFYAGTNSTNVSNTTGFIFAVKPDTPTPYVVRFASAQSSGTTATATFQAGAVATAGNLLIAALTSFANPGTVSIPGFTILQASTSGAYMTLLYKISDGTETGAVFTDTASSAVITGTVIEVDGFTGTPVLDTYGKTDGIASTTSAASTSLSNLIAPALALSWWSTANTAGASVSLTNNWQPCRLLSESPYQRIAGLPLLALGAQTSTYTWTTARAASTQTVIVSSPSRADGFFSFMP
jgi:hypothetical protein